MFSVIPAGENRFYASYDDRDREVLIQMLGKTISNPDKELLDVYLCSVVENILRAGIENYE